MDSKTIETYNALAKEYDAETADFWELFPPAFLDEFARVSGSRILDVGSGPGRDGLLFKARSKVVTCLDASRAMIDMSRARGLESVVGDFLALPFEDAAFDAVWAYTSLLHISKSDIAIALDEIVRVLKPNGVLGLGMIEGEGSLYRANMGEGAERLFSYYSKDELEELLNRHNFSVVFFEMITPGSKKYLHCIARKI